MCNPSPRNHQLFRILLYRKDATEILLESTPGGCRLPTVSIPPNTRTAEELTAEMRRLWRLEAYCLFQLPIANPQGILPAEIAEACRPDEGAPAGMRWMPAASTSCDMFADVAEFGAVQKSLSMFDDYRLGQPTSAFGKPEWLREVKNWVRQHAAAAGLNLTEKFRQLNAGPAFSLIRFETDGPALWFKAVGEPNLREFFVTLKLAAIFPNFLPRILATQPEWNAWLAIEATGSPLNSTSDPRPWEVAAENLVSLQRFSLGWRFDLIEAGCRDLRPYYLQQLIDPFFDSITTIMQQQTKLSPSPLSETDLLSLREEIRASFKDLEELSIPNTLGHLDMNPENLIVAGTRCIFLDWAEAYIGPPFFTLQFLIEHSRLARGVDAKLETDLASRYTERWRSLATGKQITRALALSPLLATYAFAAGGGIWNANGSLSPQTSSLLRGLTRRMQREVANLRAPRRSRPVLALGD